jgi:hypothetical protein
MTAPSITRPAPEHELVQQHVRSLLGPDVDVIEWTIAPIGYALDPNSPVNGGVFRVVGSALRGGRARNWSMILKELHSPGGRRTPTGEVIPHEMANDPNTFSYWRREPLAYTSGLLDGLPGDIIAPRCLGLTEPKPDHVWLWLVDLADTPASQWPAARLLTAARQLGAFNGAYLSGQPLPDADWIGRRWLRGWTTVVGNSVVEAIERYGLPSHPAISGRIPATLWERLRRLWVAREGLLAAIEAQPLAFCHLDAFNANLFSRDGDGRSQTVLIDWALASLAAPGEELPALIIANALTGIAPVALCRQREESLIAAYLAGLREAGFEADEEQLRFTYEAAAPLRYAPVCLAPALAPLASPAAGAADDPASIVPDAAIAGVVELTDWLFELGERAINSLDRQR